MTRKAPTHPLQIAKNSFAPDELLKFYDHAAMTLTAYAEMDGIKGLQFLATPRGVLPREDIPGAAERAESNEGPIGHFMRMAREKGYASKSPQVQEALKQRTNLAHLKGFKAHLRKVRKNRATLNQEHALETDVDRYLSLREDVEGYEAVLDEMIRSKRDHRDIAVEWPRVWLNGVPVPVQK
jgi:hypothetical protein